jgi:hypothetical protein
MQVLLLLLLLLHQAVQGAVRLPAWEMLSVVKLYMPS